MKVSRSPSKHVCSFDGGCATDTAVTKMVRRLGGQNADRTIEDIRLVVHSCQWQNGGKVQQGTNEEVRIVNVKDTAVDEEASSHARFHGGRSRVGRLP